MDSLPEDAGGGIDIARLRRSLARRAAAGAERNAGEVTPIPSLILVVALAHSASETNGSPFTIGVSYTQKLLNPSSSARAARFSTPGRAVITIPVRIGAPRHR
jgi:hypothetical protein